MIGLALERAHQRGRLGRAFGELLGGVAAVLGQREAAGEALARADQVEAQQPRHARLVVRLGERADRPAGDVVVGVEQLVELVRGGERGREVALQAEHDRLDQQHVQQIPRRHLARQAREDAGGAARDGQVRLRESLARLPPDLEAEGEARVLVTHLAGQGEDRVVDAQRVLGEQAEHLGVEGLDDRVPVLGVAEVRDRLEHVALLAEVLAERRAERRASAGSRSRSSRMSTRRSIGSMRYRGPVAASRITMRDCAARSSWRARGDRRGDQLEDGGGQGRRHRERQQAGHRSSEAARNRIVR